MYGNLFSISCLAETRRNRYLSCFVIDGPEFRSDLADSMLVKLSLGQVGAGFAFPYSLSSEKSRIPTSRAQFFFKSAVQFNTTVIGEAEVSVRSFIRNRSPSPLTA